MKKAFGRAKHVSDNDRTDLRATSGEEVRYGDASESCQTRPGLQAPHWIHGLSREDRVVLDRKLMRKIDIRLLPMIILMYIMNYLDRNNIASARLADKGGLQADLGMTDSEYELSVSILFVGYILMQVPSNLFLNKFGRPAIYLPTVMIIWGTISAATAAADTFGGLIAIRFFLGFVEAAYFPGCLFYLSSWYTRKELAFRTAVLYSGSLISGAFSGLIAAGITGGMDGLQGLAAWRWLFIIEGVITIGIAFAAFFVLPNFPRTTGWLSPQERDLAAWRLQEDIRSDDWVSSEQQTFWNGFILAFKDIKTWLLMFVLVGFVSSGGITNFFPSVVQTLGYSKINTLLLTAPPYFLAVITSFTNAWHADKTGERHFHVTLPLYISIAAFIIAVATLKTAPRYLAMMLMPSTVYAGYVVALAWISNCLPRPPAKRAAALAVANAVSNATSIYVSFMYETKFADRYVIAMSVNCGTAILSLVMATILRFVLANLNNKLDRGEEVDGAATGAGQGTKEAEEKGFRYLL